MSLRTAFVLMVSLSVSVVGCGGGGKKNNSKDMAGGGGNDMGGGSNDMAAAATCNIGLQTGCNSDDKCIPSFDDSGDVSGKCVASGPIAIGGACTPGSNDNELNDNCQKGASCDNNGADATPLCKKICTANADCTTAGDKCLAIYGGDFGVCLATCTAFGSSCPTGNDCSGNWNDVESTDDDATGYFWCKPTGTAAADDECESDGDCAAGLWCDFNYGTCTPACDDTHSCEAGGGVDLSCVPFPNLANGAGYCY